jgi:hypothetical protein
MPSYPMPFFFKMGKIYVLMYVKKFLPNSLQIKVFIALLRVPKIKKSVVSNYQIEINIMSAIPM